MPRSFIRQRGDVSEWLIHFVRDLDGEVNSAMSYRGYEPTLAPDADAGWVLRNIIDVGGLLPSHSIRSGRSTIYGGSPVVCFTETPILDFSHYVKERADPERCAAYGVCLLKREVFAAGGRPVIYGLSGGIPPVDREWNGQRILASSALPLEEQYRYVAYDPNSETPLDFTHEREWRWKAADHDAHRLVYQRYEGVASYPALPLFRPNDDGGFFSSVGFLVATWKEADELSEELLNYADSGGSSYDEPYSVGLLRNAFVVPLEELEKTGARRIEDLSREMRIVASRADAAPALVEKVKLAVEEARKLAKAAAADSMSRNLRGDLVGTAEVVTYDSTSPVTAALLEAGLARGRAAGGYVVQISCMFVQEMYVNEAAAQAAVDYLKHELASDFFVNSVVD